MMHRIALGAAALLFTAPAEAQMFVDLFAGRSLPDAQPATITANEARVNDTVVPAQLRVDVRRLNPSNSTIFGARVGFWSGAVGVAVDASTLDPDIRRQTVRATANLRFDETVFGERVVIDPGRDVTVDVPHLGVPTTATFALLAMARLPRDRGVEPYAFAGPAYLITDSDLSGDWGLRAGGGLRLPLSGRFSLFGEYRYTQVDASAVAGRISGSVQGVTADSGAITVSTRLRNHAGVGGLSIRL